MSDFFSENDCDMKTLNSNNTLTNCISIERARALKERK